MKRKYWIVLIVFCLLLALDQASKFAIERSVPLYHSRGVIPGFFAITHVQNRGAAFGLLGNLPGAAIIFVIISLIAIALILTYLRQIKEGELWTLLSLSLVLTGAVGNVIDRFRLGGVVDFFDFYYQGWHWPAFNVADASITIGVMLLALKILRGGEKDAKEKH
ncbi:MAG: signal peptidase II [Deltaproteobacteria bacterium RBG_13_52_11]|nr:MAG: signal peptidase II [Deltaproteobacteria bacterium RBG_13_52_11]